MTLKEQTCTAEQGARLVELGVKPVATFYHMAPKDGPHGEYIQYGWSSEAIAPAYNVAELGDMLPFYFDSGKDGIDGEKGPIWGFSCHNMNSMDKYPTQFALTEAQARATMLIHILENNLKVLPQHWQQDINDPCADGRCKLPYSKDYEVIKALPRPTEEDLKDLRFKAMWSIIKTWTIHAPEYYKGYLEGVGGHVKLLLDTQKEVMNESNPIPGTIGSDH